VVVLAGVVMDWLRPQDSATYAAPVRSSGDLRSLLGDTSGNVVPPLYEPGKPFHPSREPWTDGPVRPFGPEPRDSGGYLSTYYNAVLKANLLREPVRIRGTCISACTVYLGAKDSCVYPDAVLWFHAAHHPETRAIDRQATQEMMNYWPPAVRGWARRNGVESHVEFSRTRSLTGVELVAMGVRPCR